MIIHDVRRSVYRAKALISHSVYGLARHSLSLVHLHRTLAPPISLTGPLRSLAAYAPRRSHRRGVTSVFLPRASEDRCAGLARKVL